MLDITIAVFIGLVTLATAYLGVHVTIHPAESDRAKFWYKFGFGACGVIGCVLIGIQTERNNQAQSALRVQMGRIEKNTKTPPTVQVTNNVPAAQVIYPPSPAPAEHTSVAQTRLELRRQLVTIMDDIRAFYHERIYGRPGEFDPNKLDYIDRAKEKDRWEQEYNKLQAPYIEKGKLYDIQTQSLYETRFQHRLENILTRIENVAGIDIAEAMHAVQQKWAYSSSSMMGSETYLIHELKEILDKL